MTLVTAAWTLGVGAVFGLALAAPPGPMNAVIAEESVLRGWLAGFTAGLGAMTADIIFFLLALAGIVAFLENAPTVRAVMVAIGGILMLYFAVGALRGARETFTADGEDNGDSSADGAGGSQRVSADDGAGSPVETTSSDMSTISDTPRTVGFRKALVLALTNPYQILFWLTVGVGLLRPGTVDVLAVMPVVGSDLAGLLVVRTGSPALLAGLFVGVLVWIVGFPATLVSVGRRVDAFAPGVAAISAVVLAGFGVTFLWTAAGILL
jgi:threonine/homoserine/homoserine lactone efflux protein